MTPRGRRWLELSARSRSADGRAPLLPEALLALGGRAIEERAGWYVTHVPEPDEVDEFAAGSGERLIALTDLHDLELRWEWREHQDWAVTWRRGLGLRRITDRIVVRPTWVGSDETERDIVIVLDPGMAFGTAEHGTTRGCLRLLDKVVSAGERVLDLGAGSGILSIAAAHLGAAEVLSVEADPVAFETLRENLERNGVTGRVVALESRADREWLWARGPFSGIVANIDTGTLFPLLPGFSDALPAGAWLILSGILEDEWPAMSASVQEAGFRLLEIDADGLWRSGLLLRSR